jgi:hypothetical protein
VEYLVDAAIRGGSKDNVTGAFVRVGVPDHPDAVVKQAVKQIAETAAVENEALRDEPLIEGSAVPETRPRSVLPWLVLGVVIGALACAAALILTGHVKGIHATSAKAPVVKPVPPKPLDVDNLVYSAPHELLVQPVIGNLIAGSDAGVIVAQSESGNLLSISSTGEVRPAGHIDPKGVPAAGGRYMATDTRGYVYLTTPTVKMIRRVTPDGTIQRPICQDLIEKPEALYVAKDGSIYVIDDNKLMFIKATPMTVAVPASGKPAGDARPYLSAPLSTKPSSGAN